jgi:hypothetical protein
MNLLAVLVLTALGWSLMLLVLLMALYKKPIRSKKIKRDLKKIKKQIDG